MSADDHFVFEIVSACDNIVQMRMTVFVDLLFAVIGGYEGHFGDQDLGFVHVGAVIQALGGSVAGVGNQRDANLVCYIGSRQFDIANLVAG